MANFYDIQDEISKTLAGDEEITPRQVLEFLDRIIDRANQEIDNVISDAKEYTRDEIRAHESCGYHER